MKIYVYLCHKKSFNPFSKLIRLFQGQSSHVAIAINTNWDRTLLYHASFTGVNFMNYSKFLKEYKIDNSYSIEVEDIGTVYRACVDHLDVGYSLRLILFHLFNTFGLTIKWLLKSNGFVCSSLVGSILFAAKVPIDSDPVTWDIITAKKELDKINGRQTNVIL